MNKLIFFQILDLWLIGFYTFDSVSLLSFNYFDMKNLNIIGNKSFLISAAPFWFNPLETQSFYNRFSFNLNFYEIQSQNTLQ